MKLIKQIAINGKVCLGPLIGKRAGKLLKEEKAIISTSNENETCNRCSNEQETQHLQTTIRSRGKIVCQTET